MYTISLIHAQLNCSHGYEQLFYDDAESMDLWTFDDDGIGGSGNWGSGQSDYCYSGGICTEILDYDFVEATDPSYTMSSPVNTAGYIDIEVIYHVSNNGYPNSNCQSFYSEDNGGTWNLIHEIGQIGIYNAEVRQTLSDIGATIILKLTMDTENGLVSRCFFDEIRICGRATEAPTTASPTTASAPITALPTTASTIASSPTESSDSGSHDDSGDDDSNDSAAAAKALLIFNENEELNDDNIHNNYNDTIDVQSHVITVHFSNETGIFLWLFVGVTMVVYVIFCLCHQRKKGGAKTVYESSTMENVHISILNK